MRKKITVYGICEKDIEFRIPGTTLDAVVLGHNKYAPIEDVKLTSALGAIDLQYIFDNDGTRFLGVILGDDLDERIDSVNVATMAISRLLEMHVNNIKKLKNMIGEHDVWIDAPDLETIIYGIPDFNVNVIYDGNTIKAPIRFNGNNGVHRLRDIIKAGYKPISVKLANGKSVDVRMYRTECGTFILGVKISNPLDVGTINNRNGEKIYDSGLEVQRAIYNILEPYIDNLVDIIDDYYRMYYTNEATEVTGGM